MHLVWRRAFNFWSRDLYDSIIILLDFKAVQMKWKSKCLHYCNKTCPPPNIHSTFYLARSSHLKPLTRRHIIKRLIRFYKTFVPDRSAVLKQVFFCKTIYSFHKTGQNRYRKTNHYILLTNVSIKRCIKTSFETGFIKGGKSSNQTSTLQTESNVYPSCIFLHWDLYIFIVN